MKRLPILRWMLIGIIRLIMLIIGLIVVPIAYPFRKALGEDFIFFNKYREGDLDSGLYGRYSHNFWGYLWQTAIRNPHSNFRNNYFVPKTGKTTIIKDYNSKVYDYKTKEIVSPLYFCNIVRFWGYQNIRFEVEDTLYFRFSFSYKIWNRVLNTQLGVNEKRYVYKFRFSKIN